MKVLHSSLGSHIKYVIFGNGLPFGFSKPSTEKLSQVWEKTEMSETTRKSNRTFRKPLCAPVHSRVIIWRHVLPYIKRHFQHSFVYIWRTLQTYILFLLTCASFVTYIKSKSYSWDQFKRLFEVDFSENK